MKQCEMIMRELGEKVEGSVIPPLPKGQRDRLVSAGVLDLTIVGSSDNARELGNYRRGWFRHVRTRAYRSPSW